MSLKRGGVCVFSSRCCPRLEQPTVVCHVSVVTVDFEATFKDVLVCNVVLMVLTSALLPVVQFRLQQ